MPRKVFGKLVKVVLVCICCVFMISWILPFIGPIRIGTLLHASARWSSGKPALTWPSTVPSKMELKFANQSDIVFTVKTSIGFHNDRVKLILETWRKDMESQVSHSTRVGLSKLFSIKRQAWLCECTSRESVS